METSDLIPAQNPGASYFGEAAYITPHEYTWCQSHPTQCNMFNNYSYRRFSVNGGPAFFNFPPVGSTVRMQPAIQAWAATAATVNQIEPDPGNDGIWLMGYKVTNPSAGVWHYEYALFNMNLDRSIQSFSVPLSAGANVSNIGFHAPPQHPGWAHDGTQGDAGYSSAPWSVTQAPDSITWNTETFAQNQNANAIRWGTLYNFRFDADQPPQAANATVGYFKTGSPMMVAIQGPAGGTPTPTPTATATATATATPPPRQRQHRPPRPRQQHDRHGHGNEAHNTDRHGNSNTNRHGNGNTNRHTETNAIAKTHRVPKASSNSSAAPIAGGDRVAANGKSQSGELTGHATACSCRADGNLPILPSPEFGERQTFGRIFFTFALRP